jgi:tRNA A-37 threonylcarbamoyl transferase component Bud32
MNDYINPEDLPLLQESGLASFSSLWELPLTAIDKPNVERGGWSGVFRLELEGQWYFLKRQSNYLTRTLRNPFGEPTVAREFRNIMRYRQLEIPTLQVAFYGERKTGDEHRAILLTRALDGWQALADLLPVWQQTANEERRKVIRACAELIGTLHASGLRHGCLYPKHLFLRRQKTGLWRGCLIDLEKTRRLCLVWDGRVKDLETFLRTVKSWSSSEERDFLECYMATSRAPGSLASWQERIGRRRSIKERRH